MGQARRFPDGEIQQDYEVTLLAGPVDGIPAADDEASEAGCFPPDRLPELDIHPTLRRQVDYYLASRTPHID